jgi:molecular chaperone DnaK (HSP70)
MALRYAVGIDLGTSNTALAYAELGAPDPGAAVRVFEVPQLTAAGEVSARALLPSHLYLPGEHELAADALRLPWAEAAAEQEGGAARLRAAVGLFAREQGARVAGRHVFSAKSWLCHAAVDRQAAILPWGAPAEVQRISPVEASARILGHLRAAWDHAHPDAPLAEQELVITVPASFDEAARALSLEAAQRAGLSHPVLLEEPQAAFYDWTRRHRQELSEALSGARLLLVVDVGGGTTDLTLIEAQPPPAGAPEGTAPKLQRLAVGDHLLLGGDNMDLALARRAEAQLLQAGARLTPSQWGQLVQAARAAKELLLRPDAPEETTLTVAGAGSRLIGGALSTRLLRDEVRALLLGGFFPEVGPQEQVARSARAAGLAELGLPYAQDPAITRHAAAFLRKHAATVAAARGEAAGIVAPVDAVLYNGGALAPALLADRLTAVVASWRPASSPRLLRLSNDAPDLAVARGAATYALVRRGLGLRIGGGSPRTYYLGLGGAGQQALCVIPRGAPEGQMLPVEGRSFSLTLGRPVRFPLWAASGYRPERPGDLLALEGAAAGELSALPPLQAVVPGEGAAEVELRAALTEIGTLEVFAHDRKDDRKDDRKAEAHRWKLEFQLREGAGEAGGISALPRTIEQAREAIAVVYSKKAAPLTGREVKDLWRTLEKAIGDRAGWPLAVNRDLWGVLWAGAQKRRRSPDHERMFLALCGFLLRPGFGAPLDSWRVEQCWTLFAQGLTHHKEAPVWASWWVLWRRIAAGLPDAAHAALFEAIAPHLKPPPKGRVANPGKKPPGLAADEMVRLCGALERLPPAAKQEAAGWLLERLAAGQAPGVVWALGRLGARVPVASAAHHALPLDAAAALLEQLLSLDWKRFDEAPFAVAQLARLSGDRARDLPQELRERAAQRLSAHGAPAEWAQAIREVHALGEKDEQRVFGEALPSGLHLA